MYADRKYVTETKWLMDGGQYHGHFYEPISHELSLGFLMIMTRISYSVLNENRSGFVHHEIQSS